MKKTLVTTIALGLALLASPVLAHHPAEDIVDEEIYAMIDEMVSDTPHATLVFDEMGSTTEITVPSVSDAEDMIADYLLADLSLLDEDVTVEITFGEDDATESSSVKSTSHWLERDDWGRPVIITIDTLLCIPDPITLECEDIVDEE